MRAAQPPLQTLCNSGSELDAVGRTGKNRRMKTLTTLFAVFFVGALLTIPSFAQQTSPSPATASSPSGNQPAASGQPNQAEMMKQMMDGRYFIGEFTGKMQMPGPDGKMKDMTFKGMSFEGYDNAKQKFVSSWIDNMGTGIMMSEGTYDPATKAFTYNSEIEMMPGMKQKVREVIKIVDNNHHTFEWYEDRGGQEAKTMEINYTRKK